MIEQPVACHFMRRYATPTETFIVNQIAATGRYLASVMCRNVTGYAPISTVPAAPPQTFSYLTGAGATVLEGMAYRYARMASPAEKTFYVDALARIDPQVVHAHYGTDAAYLVRTGCVKSRTIVVSWYGYDVSRFPSSHLGLGSRYFNPLWEASAWHLAMTPAMVQALTNLGAPPERIILHHHGIDVDAWSTPVYSGERVPGRLLMVASMVEKKGHRTLLHALAELRDRHVQFQLRLAGDGSLRRELEVLARELGIEAHVEFLGHLDHSMALKAEYAMACAFVHPSQEAPNGDAEGLPGTILEAMASGLPVISTHHAGIPFAVRDRLNGLLVPERDSSALARAIESVLMSPNDASVMGLEGRAIVEREFNLKKQVEKLELIYDRAAVGE